jgi:sugar-specific transcriptional regulator TrmB
VRGTSPEKYTDRRCDDLQRALDVLRADTAERLRLLDSETGRRVGAVKEQAEQSREALEHRLDGMNEFREQLRDQAARLVTRELLDGIVSGLQTADDQQEQRLRQLEKQTVADESTGAAAAGLKSDRQSRLTTVVAIITTVLFLISAVATVVLATRPGH